MTLSRAQALSAIEIYAAAWINQDPDAILRVFTDDAEYHERVWGEPHRGHAAIRQYWVDKVVKGQSRITFKLLSLFIDGDTAIAEWEAEFDDRAKSVRKAIREVAILQFNVDGRIRHLREYWSTRAL